MTLSPATLETVPIDEPSHRALETAGPPAHRRYDVVVIGAGPAGSTVATLLARAGRSVLVLERENFPRFSIGESLIPGTHDVLARLGMLDALRASAFVPKHSVQFISASGRASAPFYFREIDPSERSQTWQVVRADFDAMLLENAQRAGAAVCQGAAVTDVLFESASLAAARATGVRARFSDGEARKLAASVVVDASGRRSLLARRLGLRTRDPRLKMAAIFSRFEGGARGTGIDEGATLIIHTENRNGWVWYIPLPEDQVSVGVVGPITHLIEGRSGDPQQVFEQEIARCPGVVPLLKPARQIAPVRVLNDFSYGASRVAGPGWVLVGDAYSFLDPIYSSGVLLALKSGEMAADAMLDAFAARDLSAARLGAFQPSFDAGMRSFRRLVYAFYDKRFSFARFLKNFPEHREAVVDLLVGDVFDRRFDRLFAAMEQMIPNLGPTLPVPAGHVANRR